jgi:aldehyde dehydrogenase (NAD+)
MTSVAEAVSAIAHPDQIFAGGEWVRSSSAKQLDVIDPSTEQLLFRVPDVDAADMSRAVAAAREAFDRGPWTKLSHAERGGYLRAIAEGIAERANQLSSIWSSQMGILSHLADFSVARASTLFESYADLADEFEFVERRPTSTGSVGLLVREPVGVVGAIIPWNAPLAMITHKVAPALLAGCTVVLKASPEAPGEAYLFAEIAEQVGLPPGVVNVVAADREVSELLVRDPRIDKITFTGSTAVGRRIAGILADRIGRFTLELGGKSAAVVMDDYDVEKAADVIAGQACHMSGQVCASLTRVVVSDGKHDALVEALASRLGQTRLGSPFDPNSTMGPVVSGRQRERVEGYIAKGIAEGAKLAVGGQRPSDLDRGFFIQPTVFGDVDNSSTIAREEIFGPVVSVIRAANDNVAVDIANDTIYGLNASVFSNDVDRAYAVARQLRSGTVGHNGFRVDFGIAFGGFKQSGSGREGGLEGLLTFLESKTVVMDAEPAALTGAD